MSYGKILVVDDEEHIVELIKYNLESNGYEIITAFDGNEAYKKALEETPDLILLDIMLPILDGMEVCKKLKRNKDTEDIPVIMLTAKGEETDKVIGLELGADDYITKPFGIRELVARIKAVLRRSSNIQVEEEAHIIKIDNIIIDIESHEVSIDNEVKELTLKEFELLKVLAENRGKVLSRNYLLDKIWGYDFYGETRTVDVHIRHLRKKLNDTNHLIETIRGVGYKVK
ncbi:response regulator transcription factor [Clostridium sp. D2Q-11]|uniref:Response regulator transcription factor n=1 Tax=Anaeromonas frigoriresistens TaxID=2683708 RepID=A0A942UWV1_9FIRM|nr:response regulator transcription factor [Anaeromonas frigoriresistens]MBS4540073.1 response regulator transcription factor [Anaeromonas frigoriresistens]